MLVRAVIDGKAQVVYREGAQPSAVAELRRFLGIPLVIERVAEAAFDELLRKAYEGGSGEAGQIVEGIEGETDLAGLAEGLPEPSDLMESEDDAPVIRLINAVLTQAVKENASDIHVEPYENRLVVRFRVDGVLREVLQTKRAVAPLLISRIKVMSRLDIAEKRLPQDGRISLRIAGRAVDVRVSTLPSGHGERVVLRLLDKQAGRLDLASLGMEPRVQGMLDDLIHKPHGIILVTGPTGSGKTTTLYAALERINDRTRNILTVEDPIEYYIDGIGQTQVNTKVEMTFARGLRAILRQDPDVVMVGEIRDTETAQIAVQASLTGHLVLSTLHTNTAVGAVTRLRDMGVEPFLLASTLLGVVAQRLVRVLNPETRIGYPAGEYEARLLGLSAADAGRADALPPRARRRRRLPRPHRHLRARHHQRPHARDDPRRRRRARTRARGARGDARHPRRRPRQGAGRHDLARGTAARHPRGVMAAYEYTALDAAGREQRGVLDGDSARQVRALLREQALLPVSVTEISDTPAPKAFEFSFSNRIGASDLALLTRQLSTLVRSGIPLEEALLAVSQQSEKVRVRSVIAGVRSRVMEGRTLAEGLGAFPTVFPEIYRATVSAGEQSGHLDAVLERMADYTENRQILQQKIRNAMIYPVLLTVICLGIVGLLLGYVVPEVVRVFEAGERELPILTRLLIAASDFLRAWWWLLLAAIVAGVWGFRRWVREPGARRRYDSFKLRLPLVGRITRGNNAARFARTFSILTASAVPVLEALRIAAEVVTNTTMRQAVAGRGRARARGRADRPLARRQQAVPADADPPDRERRDQRRTGGHAGARGRQPGAGTGRGRQHRGRHPRADDDPGDGRVRFRDRHRASAADLRAEPAGALTPPCGRARRVL